MISVSAVASASGAASYYSSDNYYTAEQGAETSTWAGEGAERLGLEGRVETAEFEAVLAGKLPDGSVIDAKRGGGHRPGTDVTFSASKSVSLLALLGGDKRIVEALRESVGATLEWIEQNLIEARVWNGSEQVREKTENLVAATFLHDVNRNGEPQLHIHAVIAHATLASDGKWHALKNDELYVRQHVMGAVFNTELRLRIEALGYETVPAKNAIDGSFEIKGVSRDVIEAFSTRSAEIAAALESEGRGSAREREIAALATRSAKAPELEPEARFEAWRARAESVGFDASRLVRNALDRSENSPSIWARAAEGVNGIGRQGLALAAQIGLTPRDGDPLVPERLGRLDVRAFAVAQVVASTVRDLSEREAAFDRLDLVRAALERGGPATVKDVEARIDLLANRGLLIGDGDKLVTTALAVKLEQSMLEASRNGRGQGSPIVDCVHAGARAQAAARDLDMRRLSPRQEAAATLLLSSNDRVVIVQGVAGAGKSAVLAPVAQIARDEGRAVIGLAVGGVVARSLGKDTGADASTLASFLARYGPVANGTASAERTAHARATLKGAYVLVDESSMVGTSQMRDLLAIANRLEVGRLALIGDTRQLGAVEAGKPFTELQRDGGEIAELPDNLRARSDLMKETAAALNAGDIARAFELLQPVTREVPRDEIASTAVAIWGLLPAAEREQTLLLASGRAMRTAANAEAQTVRRSLGEIGGRSIKIDVLDRVTVTKEAARDLRVYQDGRVVEWRTDLPRQGFKRGEMATVIGTKGSKVAVRMTDGRTKMFEPDRLPRNLKHDAVTIAAIKQIALHEGDRIRLTEGDAKRDLKNADLARVEAIGDKGITISMLSDGTVHDLNGGDRLLARLDLAYALNAHIAQGVTAEHGIVMMSAAERKLASAQSFLVAMTRIVDKTTLVLDNGQQLERAVMRNPGEKTSALDIMRRLDPKEWKSLGGITRTEFLETFKTREDRDIARGLLRDEKQSADLCKQFPGLPQDKPMQLDDLVREVSLSKAREMDYEI